MSARRTRAAIAGVMALAGASAVWADEATRCVACHGADGLAATPGVPNLAGQKRGYLVAQLRAFRDGTRIDPSMQAAVSGLDDDAFDRLARHFAALPSPPLRTPAADAPGRNAAATCTPCHGAFGRSGNDAWPNLAGQRADYLAGQLKAFASGKRRDVVMSRIAGPLDADSMSAIATYFEDLKGASEARLSK